MYKIGLIATLLVGVATLAVAQTDVATDITKSDYEKVLKDQPKATDHTLKVVDMGSYQLAVGIVHRGPTNRPAGARRAPPPGQAQAQPCGVTSVPTGSKPVIRGGISHDDTVETYIVTSGSGTLVTGGEIMNGRRSGPDSEVTKVLNGPSCGGEIVGNYVARKMHVGDMSIIPAGVPHGWTDITDHVDYLSVRPDPKKVLPHGYVNPALK